MKRRIKIQGFFIFLGIVIIFLSPKFLFPQWQQEPWDEFLDAVGISLVLSGFLFRMSARGSKLEGSKAGKILVTSGPYSLMRNPMYSGTFLIGLGIVFVLFQWWVFPLFLFIFLLIYIPQVRKEEHLLSAKFGNEYALYCKNTPKFFLKFLNLFTLDFREYLPLKRAWIKKEITPLIIVVGTVLTIEMREDVKLFGYQEYAKELLELFLVIGLFTLIISLFYGQEDVSGKD